MKKMRAIEFNTWMTLIKYIGDYISDTNNDIYGINIVSSDIKPSYPKDLSNFKKPSIIIQEVVVEQSPLCMGKGFVGQTYDSESMAYVDVFANDHKVTYQLDIFANTNTECLLLKAIIDEDIITVNHRISLYDFSGDFKHPTEMGEILIMDDIESTNLNTDTNMDYRNAIRFDVNVIQTVVPVQEFVDLSRIKITQHIKFY